MFPIFWALIPLIMVVDAVTALDGCDAITPVLITCLVSVGAVKDDKADLSKEARVKLRKNAVCGGAFVSMLIGVASLLPIFDLISDLAAFNQFQFNGQHKWALVLLLILVANWRFLTIYAALTPRPSLSTIAILYTPFALHLFWERVTKSDDDDGCVPDGEVALGRAAAALASGGCRRRLWRVKGAPRAPRDAPRRGVGVRRAVSK